MGRAAPSSQENGGKALAYLRFSLRALRPRETKKKGKISDSFENLGGKLQK